MTVNLGAQLRMLAALGQVLGQKGLVYKGFWTPVRVGLMVVAYEGRVSAVVDCALNLEVGEWWLRIRVKSPSASSGVLGDAASQSEPGARHRKGDAVDPYTLWLAPVDEIRAAADQACRVLASWLSPTGAASESSCETTMVHPAVRDGWRDRRSA